MSGFWLFIVLTALAGAYCFSSNRAKEAARQRAAQRTLDAEFIRRLDRQLNYERTQKADVARGALNDAPYTTPPKRKFALVEPLPDKPAKPPRFRQRKWRGPDKFTIIYRDFDGNQTRRNITILAIKRLEPLTLDAQCHLRGQGRSFRVDHMVEVVDAETGELIADPLAYFSGSNAK